MSGEAPELAAARATIEALSRRVLELEAHADPSRFAVQKALLHLENLVRQKDAELRQVAAFRDALFLHSGDAVLVLDGTGTILEANGAAGELLGLSPQALAGTPLMAIFDPASAASLTGLLWSGFRGEGPSELVLDGGRRAWFRVARLDTARALLTLGDPAQRWRSAEGTDHHRRLAHLAQLSSSVAHQINNPLAVIQGRIELLLRAGLSDRAAAERQLAVIAEHAKRIGQVAQNLQAIGRPQRHPRHRAQLAAVIETALREPGLRVGVDVDLEPPTLEAEVDAARLSLTLHQLAAFLAQRGARGRTVRLTGRPGTGDIEAVLSMGIEGPALPATVVEELAMNAPPSGVGLEPSATLALTLAWGLVREMGGRLEAERTTAGARLRFGLPRPLPAVESSAGAPLRILVVDDEMLLAETVCWMLAEEGHRIVAVSSAEEALVRLQNGIFDFVLADLVLPGMGGEDFLAAVANRWPHLAGRGVLTSGAIHTPRPGLRFLQKPFTRAQLLSVL